MIKLTHDTITFGYAATRIEITGVTTPNTPIAEIRTCFAEDHEPTFAYIIFTGEEFPSFTAAFEAHQKHMAHAGTDEVDYYGRPLSYAESAQRDIAREC